MNWVEGFLLAVPTANRERYRAFSETVARVFRDHGALSVVECWGEDVPEGALNSMHTAVLREPDETVVFSWIVWPSRAARDAAHEKVFADPRMDMGEDAVPFDGRRMIFGGFQVIVDA